MSWPSDPVIYEINTAVWLDSLFQAREGSLSLGEVTPAEWDSVTPHGVDAVWLMGVWERSPAGLEIAKHNQELIASFREALPDLRDDDIIGSPYCVRRYVVDSMFGGPDGLATARAALAARGVRLILDYVPNHVAPDHPWVAEHPERFVRGTPDEAATDPAAWMSAGDHVLAHGRDPYFPPWPDVVQLDAFAAETRVATADTLSDIADQCDGVRCDMAMLLTNPVFAKTWGGRTGPEPVEEFWPAVIASLKAKHPEVVLFAETYWDLEWELQRQGFDFCYDKRLYDRLIGESVTSVRDHLRADLGYQSRLLRFLENHDEPRIASRVSTDVERAAAVVIATLPGATLWHEGQFEHRRVRPPVFLRRRPDEVEDPESAAWYRRLLAAVSNARVRSGSWRLIEPAGWPDNQTCHDLLAWAWSDEKAGRRSLVVVNFSDVDAQARVPLPWTDLRGGTWRLSDPLQSGELERNGDELADEGLFVALGPRHIHLLCFAR